MSNTNMTIEEKLRQFEDLERELNLFEFKVNDYYIWERIRGKIFNGIYVGDYHKQKWPNAKNENHDDRESSNGVGHHIKYFRKYLTNCLIHNPLYTKKGCVLFYGGGRRIHHMDGTWWDIYNDPIAQEINMDYEMWERSYNTGHFQPPETDNIRWVDIIEDLPDIRSNFPSSGITIDPDEIDRIERIERRLKKLFQVDVDVQEMVRKVMAERRLKLRPYEKLLNFVEPSVVIFGWTDYELLEACNNASVLSIRLQHAHRHKYNLEVSYPKDYMTKRVYYDYKFVWGEFWKDHFSHPLPDKKVIPVGFPYLEIFNQENSGQTQNQILFISSLPYGQELSRFAAELVNLTDYNIVYKLHPGEEENWRSNYQMLSQAESQNDNLVVADHYSKNIYQLFLECDIQVGVNSTAIFEGLYFGLDTYLADISPLLKTMEHLSNYSDVSIVDEPIQVVENIGSSRNNGGLDTSYLFENNSLEKTISTIKSLVNDSSGSRNFKSG